MRPTPEREPLREILPAGQVSLTSFALKGFRRQRLQPHANTIFDYPFVNGFLLFQVPVVALLSGESPSVFPQAYQFSIIASNGVCQHSLGEFNAAGEKIQPREIFPKDS
jgi:hypothetical protein